MTYDPDTPVRTVMLSTSGEPARILPDEHDGGRILEIGGAVQSHVDLADPLRIRYEYLRRMAHVLDGVAPAGAPVRVLHLGAGALTLPRYLQATRPGSEQTVVDLDRELVSFVLAELPLPAGTDLVSVVADARLAAVDLAMDGERFDAVVLDIGTGEEGAEHLRGAVFYEELLELLTAGGVLLVNIGDDAGLRFLGAELGALEEAAAEAGVPGPWTLADQGMLERLDWGNVVLAAGAPLGEAGCPERLAAAGPHPAAVLDPAESAALASRIRRA
ncbi:spermidine synthase [Micrococcus luteus]|uniref:spermidine synthase n=1 Tax=Micrococcus luteus TaxID=1270 RepID=UPI00398FF290